MKKFRIVAILLVMCLASSCFVGSTFAKYSSATWNEDQATIAQWNVVIDDESIDNRTKSFNLFNTIYNTDGEEEDNTREDYIAPGTQGSFSVKIENDSDVTIAYSVNFEISGMTDINIEFSKNRDFSEAVSDLSLITFTNSSLAIDSEPQTCTIYWRWVFHENEAGDIADTTDGITARQNPQPAYTVLTYVSATQVN